MRIVDRVRSSDRVRRARAWLRAHPRSVLVSLGGLLGAAALVVAVMVGTGRPSAEQLTPGPQASAAQGSVAPTTPESPTQPSEEDWSALTLPPYEPQADLLAATTAGSRVATTTSFTIRSLTATPAVQLAKQLVVEPSAELTVEPGATSDVAIVRPAAPLMENAAYRFALQDPSGALLDEWTFRTSGPLRVVRRLPENASTQVPLDTGIEFEFDQDGVDGFADSFSIEPTVAGRFEQHGRSWAFVPTDGLAPATLYTVTVRAGLGVEGSEQGLESDLRIAFETAASGRSDEPRVVIDHPLYEIRPGDPAVIPVGVSGNVERVETVTRRVTLFDLGTAPAAMDAAATLSVDRSWATWSSNGSVATDGLAVAGTFDAVVRTQWDEQRLELPSPLTPGFYLLDVDQPGRHAQLVLQVTDLATYLLASEREVMAWVNDLAADAPVAAATVSLADGTVLGQTDEEGLLSSALPGPLLRADEGADFFERPEPALVLVTAADGSQVIAAIGADDAWFFGPQAASLRWWLLLGTDRLQYRSDDVIRVWGFARSRADRSVPKDLELRLLAGWDPYAPPIVRQAISATPRGVVLGELPVEDLPPGQYSVALFVGDVSVAQASVTVTDIRKPSFRIDLTSGRHAFIDGERITARLTATFFDGTVAPGLELRVGGFGISPGDEEVVKLGSDGAASLTFEAAATSAMLESGGIHAVPASPEEGGSLGDANFALFPSSVWLEADARLDGGTLTVSGTTRGVDLAAAEGQFLDTGWVEDPGGDPLGGQAVAATVERITWKAVQTGTSYDFIEKKAVPTYNYERQVERIGSFTPVSGADGSFELSLPFDADGAGAEVTLRATDAQGRTMETHAWSSSGPEAFGGDSNYPYLERPAICASRGFLTAELGEPYEVSVRAGDGAPSAEGRTLFVVSRSGIDDVVVTTGAGIERLLEDADLPSVTIRAVRLTPSGYIVMNDVAVSVDPDDKTIAVKLAPDRERYAPGDEISIGVTTVGPGGQAIAADVIVQAVDAKLVAIGAATEVDPSALMLPTGSGFAGSYATHLVPEPALGDGCGAATGGGDVRDEFKDNATFQLIQTGPNGRGTATFEAPDDLTSWIVSAAAFSGDLDAGGASIEVPVGLPFFVDATIAPEYLVDEEPIIQLRAFGDALDSGDAVAFTIEAPSLGLDQASVDGRAFEHARVRLPALTLGEHVVTITARGPGDLRDAVARTVRVVPTRLRTLQAAYGTVGDRFDAPGGDGMTTYLVTDGGRGALVPVLEQLAWSASARLDASLAAELARRILIGDFALPESAMPASGWGGIGAQPPEGLAIMPYTSADLFLTARAALVAPDQVSPEFIVSALTAALDDDPTRERAIVALAGLAGAGRDVLAELQAIDPEPLTVRERLWLALGLSAAGDTDAAREIERSTLTEHGQRLGSWVRLGGGTDTPEWSETTASALLLAARLRDPIAIDISRYLLDNPSRQHLAALEQLGFARAALEWLPRAEARFAWTVQGERHEEALDPGESLTLTLTRAQRESLALEPIEGELFVASTWLGAARYEDLSHDGSVTIQRTVSPADHAPADDLVHVTLKVHFNERLKSTCYQVTDLLPSGLAPVVQAAWPGMDPTLVLPYEAEGQRLSWCIGTDRADVTLGYAARVVSAGTYRWEPAVIQAIAAPNVGSATPVISYTID